MRKAAIHKYSNEIAQRLDLLLENKEFKLGSWGRADNYVKINDRLLILFEVEIQQRHPEMNVLKVWPFLKEVQNINTILIQYIVDSNSCSPNRIRLIHWLQEQMYNEYPDRYRYHMILNSIDEYHIVNIKESIQDLSR